MDCRNCGYALKPSEKECPRCIYIANTVREYKQRQQQSAGSARTTAVEIPGSLPQSAAQVTYCSACGNALEAGVRFCKDCGAPQQGAMARSVAPPPPALPTAPVATETSKAGATPNVALIAIIWTLTAVEILLITILRLKPPTPFFIDLPAFVMAILLAGSQDRISRWNGWAKLAVDGIGIVTFGIASLLHFPS
jgi:hypothetical protein